jgi:hypothetical protein
VRIVAAGSGGGIDLVGQSVWNRDESA